jgi:hypothetical protein
VLATNIAIVWLCPRNYEHAIAATIDKQALLKNADSPKIVFVGGSGVSFGLDSEMVRRELGMTVVNMGLHAGLGLRYMLAEVRPYINPGDVVVVIPEYAHFDYLLDGSRRLRDALVVFPKGVLYLSSARQVRTLVEHHPQSVRDQLYWAFELSKDYSCRPPHCRSSFNEYGDNVGHLGKKWVDRKALSQPVSCKTGPLASTAIDTLNDFNRFAEGKQAKVFFFFPSIPEPSYSKSKGCIVLLQELLVQDLEIPLLNTPDEHIFPIEYFFNTQYHLNVVGREIRTQRIIEALERALGHTVDDPAVAGEDND